MEQDRDEPALTTTELQRRFGEHLRRLRGARSLTQEALAERSDLSVDAIRRIERGALSPTLETVNKLSGGLDLSLQTLFQTFERPRLDHAALVCDYLCTRSPREVRLVWRVVQALFDGR